MTGLTVRRLAMMFLLTICLTGCAESLTTSDPIASDRLREPAAQLADAAAGDDLTEIRRATVTLLEAMRAFFGW